MKSRATIKDRVLEEVFDDWDNKGVEVARDKLKKMFMIEYPTLSRENIEEKRLILHNLAVAEIEVQRKNGLEVYEMESVKLYTSILKNEMDKIEGYKEGENACLYSRVLINYIESHKKDLTKEELIKNYELCYKIYEQIEDNNENGHLSALVAKFNLNMITENFTILLNIFEELIHNSDDSEYNKKLYELLEEVKQVNQLLYERISLLLKKNKKLQAI
jgi:hypothetical protein